MERTPEKPKLTLGMPVRLKANAESRSRAHLPMGDMTYYVCWRDTAISGHPRLLLSERMNDALKGRLSRASDEIAVQQALAAEGCMTWYVDEEEVVVDIKALNQK